VKRAQDYLSRRSKKKTEVVREESVNSSRRSTEKLLQALNEDGQITERPKTRADCPDYRPCPFVTCRYNLLIDLTSAGSIKINFPSGVKDNMETCALDLIDQYPDGLTLQQIGTYTNLTRERARQIEEEAIQKIASSLDRKEELIVSLLEMASNTKGRRSEDDKKGG